MQEKENLNSFKKVINTLDLQSNLPVIGLITYDVHYCIFDF